MRRNLLALALLLATTAAAQAEATYRAALVVEPSTWTVLYSREPHMQLPTASMIKMLNALVAMDAIGRGAYDALLVDAYVPLVPGLTEQLESGVRVADVACGTGHALVLLGRAFPESKFVGYDLDEGIVIRRHDYT